MGVCHIIPLGGLGEVGKNMTVFEADGSIVVVDAGLAFPRDEHLGVDLVLPDFTYLREREHMIRGVVLTHGHEDHVGSLPYLMREVKIPVVVATRLTLGLVKSKLDEHGLLREADLREVSPYDEPFDLGPFRIEFIRMAHSIPDAVAVVLETPGGRVVHTGDYKIDHTPVDGQRTDVGKLAELGNRGVALLLGDSTNAERAGVTQSERVVGEAFRQIFPSRTGKILVSSFASNVHRMQQAADVGIECGRKVAFVGRSMRKNANIARNLGYMNVPEEAILRPHELAELPPHEQLILCTGSQGEPMSAMTRIAYDDHPAVKVERGDTVIISAKPIPGNELRAHRAARADRARVRRRRRASHRRASERGRARARAAAQGRRHRDQAPAGAPARRARRRRVRPHAPAPDDPPRAGGGLMVHVPGAASGEPSRARWIA